MKSNPCFECICNPICRNKFWAKAVIDCTLLQKVVYLSLQHISSKHISSKHWDMIKDIESKKFFDIKFLESI